MNTPLSSVISSSAAERTFAWGHAGMFQKLLFSLGQEHELNSSD